MSQVGVNFARSCRDSSPDHRPPSVTPEPAATSGSHRELSSGHPPKPESESESGREAPALSNVTTGAPVRLARASRRRYAASVPTARPLKSWSVCRKGLRKISPPRQVTNRLGLPAVEGLLHRPQPSNDVSSGRSRSCRPKYRSCRGPASPSRRCRSYRKQARRWNMRCR
jgi:hypothetical protein